MVNKHQPCISAAVKTLVELNKLKSIIKYDLFLSIVKYNTNGILKEVKHIFPLPVY